MALFQFLNSPEPVILFLKKYLKDYEYLILHNKKVKHIVILIPYVSKNYENAEDAKQKITDDLLASNHFYTQKNQNALYSFSIYFNTKTTRNKQDVITI